MTNLLEINEITVDAQVIAKEYGLSNQDIKRLFSSEEIRVFGSVKEAFEYLYIEEAEKFELTQTLRNVSSFTSDDLSPNMTVAELLLRRIGALLLDDGKVVFIFGHTVKKTTSPLTN